MRKPGRPKKQETGPAPFPVLRHVKTIKNVNRITAPFGDHVQVATPHITAHKTNPADHMAERLVEESTQTVFGSIRCYVQQPRAARVDLVGDAKGADNFIFRA